MLFSAVQLLKTPKPADVVTSASNSSTKAPAKRTIPFAGKSALPPKAASGNQGRPKDVFTLKGNEAK